MSMVSVWSRKHCVKSVRIQSYSGPHFSNISGIPSQYGEIRSISPYSVQMWENARKMRTIITPNTDTFNATKVISCSLHMFISRMFTSCALLFKLSFHGAISEIVIVFISNFSDSARSMTDVDIWLAVLLLLSSLFPTCSIMWFGLIFSNGWFNMVIHWAYFGATI